MQQLPQPVPYFDLVARNVRVARAVVKLSQIDVAARMQALGFREWRRQTVGNTESGKRRLTAEEALGLMLALETDLTALLFPPAGMESHGILLPAGQETLLPAAKYSYNPARASIWDGNRCLLKRYPHGGHQEDQLPSVATAIVTSSRGVLVGRRNDGKPPWTFIAGEVEEGETPEFAATREVKEETGLETEARDEIGRRVHPRTGRTMIYIAAEPVRADDLEVFVGDEAELAEVRWVSLAEADELMAAYGMFEPVHDYLERELGGA